jgi:hypothetical protein
MMLLRLRHGQRAMLVDKLPDLANLSVGALVFGQLFGAAFSPVVALAGIAIWAVFIGWAWILAGGEET